MRRHLLRQWYVLHSWIGVLTALLMFVVAFTGAVAVFGTPELKTWANPEIHGGSEVDSRAIEQLVIAHAEKLDPAYRESVDVLFPGVRRTPNLVVSFTRHVSTEGGGEEHHVIRFEHHPNTLALVRRLEGDHQQIYEQRGMDVADFLIQFHADLHLGNPWGLIVTGVLGLTLLASLVTGLVIHRKILREVFTFRPHRSLRLFWTDSHKVLGVWGLLFHFVIAYTGAFLGFAGVVLVPAAAFVSFGGDQEALAASVLPDVAPSLVGEAGELKLASLLDAVRASGAGEIVSVSLQGWDDRGANLIANTLPGEGMTPVMLEYDAESANLVASHTTYGRIAGASGPLMDLMRPLHFGNFGGLLVKALWAVLGVGTALLAVTGMMVWVERRAYGPVGTLSSRQYHRISKVSVGVCGGLVLAVIALFYAQVLSPYDAREMRVLLPRLFFGSWLLGIAWAAVRPDEYSGGRELAWLCSLALLCLPAARAMGMGDAALGAIAAGHFLPAAVDLVMFILGLLLGALALRLPGSRPERARRQVASRPVGVAALFLVVATLASLVLLVSGMPTLKAVLIWIAVMGIVGAGITLLAGANRVGSSAGAGRMRPSLPVAGATATSRARRRGW